MYQLALFLRPTHILEPWEKVELNEFLIRRNLLYAKLYDATNNLYLYVNSRGALRFTADNRDGDDILWTTSGERCIENKASGIL